MANAANIVKFKRSAVAGKVPATTDLALGELALNTYDGRIYLKKSVSGTETVVALQPFPTGGTNGQILSLDSYGNLVWITSSVTSTGTVTAVSVVNANGFAGTVATSSTTPAITIQTTVTGLLKGNGTSVSAAASGTDYLAPGSLSITTNSAGTQSLSYNSATGVFTFTPADLSSYVTSSSLTSTLSSYVTSTSLSSTLSSYVTSSSLTSTLSSYVTSSSLTSTLGSYVTSSTLSGYNYISLASLSMDTPGSASGSGSVTYSNTTGKFKYTPPDLSSYATQTYVTSQGYITNSVTALTSLTSIGATGVDTTTNGNLIVSGNLTVNGTTETINSTTSTFADKNIELAKPVSPATASDASANGGGITLHGTTDKTFNWVLSTNAWTSSENIDLPTGKVYMTNGVDILTGLIKLTSLSMDTPGLASGSGSVAYDNTTGKFKYTPPDLSGYVTTSSLTSISSSLVPQANNTYNLGSASYNWDNLYANKINGLVFSRVEGKTYYVTQSGDDTSTGTSIQGAFATIKKALTVASAGDSIKVGAGTYTEIFPLTVPAGVSVIGLGIRSTKIVPTTGTNNKDAFLVSGEVGLSDFTVADFFYDSVNDTGYAFRFVSGAVVASRSPYLQRITVLCKGSNPTTSDPYGFLTGDAGRGALIDGSQVTRASIEAAMLFNECTFIVPNSRALIMKNGARAEWLTCFTYFADLAIEGLVGSTGRGGSGKTYITLLNVTGTWNVGNTISYYATDGTTLLASATIEAINGSVYQLAGSVSGFAVNSPRTAKIITVNGDAKLSTAQQKIGTASLALDGTGDYLSIASATDFNFGTGDFTIECWVYRNVSGAQHDILDFRTVGTSQNVPRVIISSANVLSYYVAGATRIQSGGTTVSASAWHHIAVSRQGTSTKLFLDGIQVGSTWTDTTTYIQCPLVIGAQYSGSPSLNGYIDEVRISKGIARYTTTFTPSSSAFVSDQYAVLLLHFDGANNSTSITDDGANIQDIRSSGGGTATGISRYDRKEFAAELRSISSANIYGNQGVKANGADVKLQLMAHNFAYIGTGADLTNNSSTVVQANEVIEVSSGRVYYNTVDQSGNFRVGQLFSVNFETGAVTFSGGAFNVSSLVGINFTDGTNSTVVDATHVATGNLILAGNTISSQTGSITIDPSGSQPIYLNGDTTVTGNFAVSGTITSGTWNGSAITNSYLANSTIVVNGVTLTLGDTSKTIKASTTNALTIGTGLTGTSFDGSSAVTVAVDTTTIATRSYVTGLNYITLTNLSTGTPNAASGSGAISYSNTTGVFTYTPPDLSSYITASVTALTSLTSIGATGVDTTANGNLIVSGNLTVNGTTETINATTSTFADKNIELAKPVSPATASDASANGGGITLHGTTDKTLNWILSTNAWTSSENVDLASGKTYKINGTDVLSSTALGSGVTGSSLTSVGTLGSLTVTNTITGSVSGNAGTATTLQTARKINGVNFDGSADITVTAAAGTLTGDTLASGVTKSSLTQVGTLTNLTVTNTITGGVTGNAGTVTNGVYTSGSYADPSWITSLAYSKLTGAPTNVSAFTNDAGYITSSVATLSSLTSIGAVGTTTTIYNPKVSGTLKDSNDSAGTAGYVLQSTGSGVQWTSPASASGAVTYTTQTLTSSQQAVARSNINAPSVDDAYIYSLIF